jgi:hypothetical protein
MYRYSATSKPFGLCLTYPKNFQGHREKSIAETFRFKWVRKFLHSDILPSNDAKILLFSRFFLARGLLRLRATMRVYFRK